VQITKLHLIITVASFLTLIYHKVVEYSDTFETWCMLITISFSGIFNSRGGTCHAPWAL